ncbi:MAG: prepilin-type N-terminal cleavage/methylation domain-containing protein [Candidatus Shapirobacteria bacterium]|nr:prepilin-type N-terminal cleavage/methylation domain-containing protein [Candidatus Shapirobacteria bacterium]
MFINKFGFSLIEIIIAIAIFSIIIAGGLTGFIPILNQNRQSNEIIQANRLAEEGLEAVRSIRNRDFNLLSIGNKGIGISSNLWNFSGNSDTTGKFTRQISITAANRDTSGILVATGGTTDPDTWLIKSLVTWSFSVGETKQFSLETILTNWHKNIGVNYDGLIVYSDGTTKPPWRTYTTTSDTFGSESTILNLVGNPRNFIIRTSPKKTEAIAGTVTNSGILYIYCFNGTTWTQDWSATVGGTATTRRFDIAYETNSGKSVVLYSTNNSNSNELNFRTKSGSSSCGSSNWSTATNYDPLQTSSIIQWVKMASNPKNNLIATIWADSNSNLSTSIWNGATFQNEPPSVTESSLEIVSSSQDVDDFDLVYESFSGDLMLIWANSAGKDKTNGVRYRLCTGNSATCIWGSVNTPPTFADDATNLDLSANPNTDEMVFASIGNNKDDLQIGYWNGTNWINKANMDTSCETPLAGTKLVATGWLISGSTTRSIIVYNDKSTSKISWFTGNGSTFTRQPDATVVPNITNPQKWYEIAVDPKNKNQLMLTSADVNSDLYAKRLVMTSTPTFTWTNSDASSPLEINLNQGIVNPFGFAYWQK